MNEVVLNGVNKEVGVTWDELQDGQVAEITSCIIPMFVGKVVQKVNPLCGYSVIEIGGSSIWDQCIPNDMRFRPLEPGETVTIIVK